MIFNVKEERFILKMYERQGVAESNFRGQNVPAGKK